MKILYDGTPYTSKEALQLKVLQELSNHEISNYLEAKRNDKSKVFRDLFKSTYKMDEAFLPNVSPQEMLALGIFSGKYINGFKEDLPGYWLEYAKVVGVGEKKDDSYNFYKISASKPLAYWKEKGWLYEYDPCGWFQWYCRYYLGRRIEGYDDFQVKRQKSFVARHRAQVLKNCEPHNHFCRLRQKQSLLHWGYFIEYDAEYIKKEEV